MLVVGVSSLPKQILIIFDCWTPWEFTKEVGFVQEVGGDIVHESNQDMSLPFRTRQIFQYYQYWLKWQVAKGSGRILEETLAMEGPGASFDFKKHVLLSEEAISSVQVHSLTEMGYDVKPGQLDFAYTDPFPFLSEEGLKLYREALTSPEVAQNCYYSSAMVPLTVRNATCHSKFLHQMSTDDHLLNAMQKVTGGGDTLQWHPFQLEQMMTNIQRVGVNKPSFAWHNDSNDFCDFGSTQRHP